VCMQILRRRVASPRAHHPLSLQNTGRPGERRQRAALYLAEVLRRKVNARARRRLLAQIFLGPSIGLLMAGAAAGADTVHSTSSETIEETTCRIVESAAHSAHVPVALLTRLVWVESRFQAGVVSSAGAQGVAQFMPQTAAERGLADPFDPEQAIPIAAKFLVDLDQQFGNIGLATAAYNAGPARVAGWLAGSGDLPRQTQVYVFLLTGRTAEDWAAQRRDAAPTDETVDRRSCMDVTATLRTEEGAEQAAVAPWGVQLAGNFSKATALASFERARQRYSRILGDLPPMIIGTRLRSRGTRPFYRVLVPASSRAKADQVCHAIMMAGGACVALRS
jgi:soluble lytic murein transglycosylase-like protein